MKKQLYVLQLTKHDNEFQFFRHDFIDVLLKNNFKLFNKGIERFDSSKMLGLLRNLNLIRQLPMQKKNGAILVASQNFGFLKTAFPFIYRYEIVPFLWDCWPNTWDVLLKALKICKCKIVFVSSSQVAQIINNANLDTKAYFIPEGIKLDLNYFENEISFINRGIDIYELGRIHTKYHQNIIQLAEDNNSLRIKYNKYDINGTLINLAFPKEVPINDFLKTVKIVISFPRSDTDKSVKGIETLTQRYWESMLNKNIIIGRAPMELINIIGYNPVIDVDWENPKKQLLDILNSTSDYQYLIDKNFQSALKFASWDNRIVEIKKILEENKYVI